MICQMGNILIMRIIKIMRKRYAVLLIRNDKPILFQEPVEAKRESAGSATPKEMPFRHPQAVVPYRNTIASEGKAAASMEDFVQFPDAAALTRPEPYRQDGDNDQEDQQRKPPALRKETEQGNQEKDTQGNHTELNIHGDDQPDRNHKAQQEYGSGTGHTYGGIT